LVNYLYGTAEDAKFNPQFKDFVLKLPSNMKRKVRSKRKIILKKSGY